MNNRPFDEALEFSHSGSDESVETKHSEKRGKSSAYESKVMGPSTASGLSNRKNSGGTLSQQNLGGKGQPSSQKVRICVSELFNMKYKL